MSYQDAVEAIEGVRESEWIPELGLYQVRLEGDASVVVIDRLREVLPVGIVPVKLIGDGQGYAIINCEKRVR